MICPQITQINADFQLVFGPPSLDTFKWWLLREHCACESNYGNRFFPWHSSCFQKYAVMAHIEENTNQLLRKKYFVDAETILIRKKSAEVPLGEASCRIVRGNKVRVSTTPYALGTNDKPGTAGQINVHLLKNKDRIEQIHIRCPCGRHTELDCRYEDAPATPAPGPGVNPKRGPE